MEDIQLTIDKLVNEIGITGLLTKIIISNIHFREDIQFGLNYSISNIAYIHAIPVLNNGIEKLINEFKKSINK